MDWIAAIINGVLLGGLYGLFGLGLAFAFGVMRIVNIAHGELIVLSAYLGLIAVESFGFNAFAAILPVAGITFLFGYLLQAVLLNRVIGNDPVPSLLVTFGVSIILRNLMVEIFGANQQAIDAGAIELAGVDIAGLRLGVLPLLTFALAVILFLSFQWVLSRTAFGRIVRATADDHEAIQLFGTPYKRVYCIAMGVSVAFSSIAGLLLAMRTTFSPFSGAERLLLAFEVVIIGGLGSIWAMLIGGIVLGVTQLVGLKYNPNAGLLYAHLIFFAILMLMPKGISGWRRR